jgi:hypothetical protein
LVLPPCYRLGESYGNPKKPTSIGKGHEFIDGAPSIRCFASLALEVWHDGQFIATVTGADGPGVRVISKHAVKVVLVDGAPNVAEVRIGE